LLSVERVFRGDRPMREEWSWMYPLKAIATFGLVLIGWVFFRAADLPQSRQILGQMFSRPGGHTLLQHWHVGLALVALVLAVGEEKFEWFERIIEGPAWAYASALAVMFLCLEVFGVIDANIPFIYFQF